jgi:hypothetical protein
MRRVREILRLKHACGASDREQLKGGSLRKQKGLTTAD